MSNNKRGKMSRRVKNTRRRNKKRSGGASGASASSSSPKLSRAQKIQRLLGNPRDSGMLELLSKRLLQPPPGILPPPRHVTNTMHLALESRVKMKRAESELNELVRRAEQLHATSFRDRNNLRKCFEANVEAAKQLREAVDMDSLRARACLADMLLNGTAGVRTNVHDKAMRLVSKVDDPDCQGVLAHCHFKDGIKAGPALAARSAAAGSKYGEYVLGLYELQKGKTKEASDYFTLAAAQNYDEAQIALGKIKMQSDPDEALRLFNLAADQGNADAFYSIAELYRRKSNDNPYTPAFMDAMKWYKFAVDANHPYAYDALNRMQFRLQRS